MNRIISNKRLYANRTSRFNRLMSFSDASLPRKKYSEPAGRASVSVGIIFLIFITFILGGLYLFQVNNVAVQGIDMKDAEIKIRDLKSEKKKMEIEEVELKSMYQIEKSTKDLDLVNADAVSYMELDSPVAMK